MNFFYAFFIIASASSLFVNADELDTEKRMAKIYRISNGAIDKSSQLCLGFKQYGKYQVATLFNSTTPCKIQLDVDIGNDFDLTLSDLSVSPVTQVYLGAANIDGERVLVRRKESNKRKFFVMQGVIYSRKKYFQLFQHQSGFSALKAFSKGSSVPSYAIIPVSNGEL